MSMIAHDMTNTEPHNKLQRLMALLAADPQNRALRSDCVALALQQRDYNVAQQLSEAALVRDPMDAQAKFERASALMGLRQFEAALVNLTELTQGADTDPAVSQNIGLCHYLLENYAAARPHLETVYAKGVHSTDLLRLLLSTLHHVGAVDEAVKIASSVDDTAKHDGSLAGVLALLYLDAEQPAQAARWSARALVANPNSVDGLVVQGTLRVGAFDLPTARQQFEHALSRAPTTARAWVGLSLASLAENDFVQARSQIEQGLRYMPQHVGSWHVLAWIDLMQGRLNEAHASFERALELDRNFAESHGGLAAIAALRGDRATAERLADIAERLNPHCLAAKFARSTLLKGAGDAEGARDTLMKALSGVSPRDGSAISRIIDEMTRR